MKDEMTEHVVAESAVQPPPESIWQGIKDALRGTEADYTRISLNKAIILLTIPMILELVMESTFALVDIYFVGKLGSSAVAAVGLTETFLFLLYSVAMGLSMGATAIIARRVGEGEKEIAGRSAVQAIILGVLFSVPFAFAGIFWSKELLALMGADQWALDEGYKYARWMLGLNVIIVLLFVINAIFRGAGDAAIAMNTCYDREGQESREKKGIHPDGNALGMAAEMGIELLDEEQYRDLQKFGEFDTRTSSWIKTPPEIRKLGGALFADRRYDNVFVYHNGAQSFYGARGFRGRLTI